MNDRRVDLLRRDPSRGAREIEPRQKKLAMTVSDPIANAARTRFSQISRYVETPPT